MNLISRKIAAFAKKVANLPPKPGGTMPVADLQAQFDAAPEELRAALNGAIDDIVADYATKSELNGLVLGQVPNGSITEPKLETSLAQKVNGGLNDCLSRQAIINGNFDIGQRGSSFTNPLSGLYTSDRFKVELNADTSPFPNVTHSRVSVTPGELDGSKHFYRISTDGAGTPASANAFYQLGQWIENGTRYLCGAGKKVTVSFYARSSIANKRIGVYAKQSYGTGGTPSTSQTIIGINFTPTSNWTRYSFTFDTNSLAGKVFGTNNDDFLSIHFIQVWGSGSQVLVGATTAESFIGAGNIDIAQIQVNAGDYALPFQPRSFAEELALCQRYYEKSYDYGVAPGTSTSNGAENVVAISVDNLAKQDTRFKVRKRITPTVTVYSAQNGAVGSVSEFTGVGTFSSDRAVNTSLISESSYVIGKTAAFNANNFERWHWTADAEL